jgi:nucleoid DNA-binding protein
MTKQNRSATHLTKKLAARTNTSHKLIKTILEEFRLLTIEELKAGNEVRIAKFFSIKRKIYKEKEIKHSITKESLIVPAHWSPKFQFREVFSRAIAQEYLPLDLVPTKKPKQAKKKIEVIDITKNNVSFQALAGDSRIMKARVNC